MDRNIQTLMNRNNMLPTAAALFNLALATSELLDSQDKSSTMFMSEVSQLKDYNEQLDLIVGTLSDLQDKLVDFE